MSSFSEFKGKLEDVQVLRNEYRQANGPSSMVPTQCGFEVMVLDISYRQMASHMTLLWIVSISR